MKPINALTGSIKSIPNLHLHILLTEEDALAALSDSIKDYLD